MGVHKVAPRETIKAALDGDDHISSFEHGLWALTYHCLLKFGCPVMFHTYGPCASHKLDRIITFFVPESHECMPQVVEFLHEELAHHELSSTKEDGEWFWGTRVEVKLFDGFFTHMERHVLQEQTEKMMARMSEHLKRDSRIPS